MTPAPAEPESPRHAAAAGAVTFGLLLAYSLVQSPVPGVNEPQYLGKALHLAEPGFCPGDFFLDSSDPHGVFSLLLGPVAARFGLPAAAYAGRAAGLGLLAAGWALLARRVVGSAWAAVVSAAAFLAAAAVGNLSGEWVVGGAEGKVFAYGLLLIAADRLLGDRPVTGAAAAGLAVSFHPVVGGWGVLCVAFAGGVGRWRNRTAGEAANLSPRTAAVAAAVFLACSAPGLWFALDALDANGADAGRANLLQVYRRLPHHLDPMTFRTPAWLGFAHLTLAWAVLRRFAVKTTAEPAFAAAVLGSLLVAYAGALIGLRGGDPYAAPLAEARAFLLKFYPFRLADVLVPLAASLALAGCAWRVRSRARRAGLAAAVTAALAAAALLTPFYDRNPAGLSPRQARAWRQACGWIDRNLPADAVVVTPTGNHAFKWHARRAEYVAFKDCPQDPAGILEWNRRLTRLRTWARARHGDDPEPGYDRTELAELAAATGATHLLAAGLGPVRAEPLFAAGPFRVYGLRPGR